MLLVDRKEFPRSKPCAGALTAKALKILPFSIDSVIHKTSTRLSLQIENEKRQEVDTSRPLAAFTLRTELDLFLLDQALDKGARFLKIGRILALAEENDAVTLLTKQRAYRARFLLGADGANSRIRGLLMRNSFIRLGFAIEGKVPRIAQCQELAPMEIFFGDIPSGYSWIFPKRDHFNIGIYSSQPDSTFTIERLAAFSRLRLGLRSVSEIRGCAVGSGGWDYAPQSERIFLIGDAAGMAEPLFGEGIYYAVKSGQLAADAILRSELVAKQARHLLVKNLAWLKQDLLSSYQSSVRLYAKPHLSRKILAFPPVAKCLAEGYAAGKTLAEIKRSVPFLLAKVMARKTLGGIRSLRQKA